MSSWGGDGECYGDYNSIIVDGRVLCKKTEFFQLIWEVEACKFFEHRPPLQYFAVVGGRGVEEDLSNGNLMIKVIGGS